jgi:hypothetical protein
MGGPATARLSLCGVEPTSASPRPDGMQRTAVPLVLALAAVLLAGCSWLAVPTPTPSGGAGSRPGAGGKPIGGGGGLVDVPPIDGALREVPDPTIVDALPTAADRYVIGPDGRTVVVYYWGGNQACFGLHSVAVELRDGVPVITVSEGTRPAAAGMACTMEAVLKSTVVTLDAPILVDASGSEPAAGEPFLPDQAQAVAPVVGVQNPRAHALTGYLLAADGVSLSAYYVGGREECYALAEASAVAGADGALMVTIREGTLPNADACDDIGVAKAASLTLDAPLLLDGSLG